MLLSVHRTKVFAFSFLFFAIVLPVHSQPPSAYVVPAGTVITVRMNDGMSSKVSSVGDTFVTTVVDPVVIRDIVVLPENDRISGSVDRVEPAAAGKDGDLEIAFGTLYGPGWKREIVGESVEESSAESSTPFRILSVIGSAAAGALLGSLSSSRNGALIGTGVGTGIGTGVALLTKGNEAEIRADKEFRIRLIKDVTLPVTEY